MRRGEKEITDRRTIDAILRSASVCRLGLADGDEPYVVPLCFGYDGESLYFHGAPVGRRSGILARNPRVCFEIDTFEGLVEAESPCAMGVHYRSVIGWGHAEVLEDREEKRRALSLIVAQYADADPALPDAALDRMAVFRVRVESVTGKASG